MARQNTLIAVAVVLLVLGIAGSGLFNTGAATIKSPLDFSIKLVQFPDRMLGNTPFNPIATFVNSGSISASEVIYDLRIWKLSTVYGKTEVFRSLQKDSKVLTLPANKETEWSLVPVDLPAGNYTVDLAIDSDLQFDETDETNNNYETTITVI